MALEIYENNLLKYTFPRVLSASLTDKLSGETNLLLHFASHSDMLKAYSEELFERYADHIEITGRNEIKFVMKCGLTFTERTGD